RYRIFGESDFSALFPSAIAAALTALVIVAWGYRIGAAAVAWWAAIIFSLSLQPFVHAKAAVADRWLVLFMTLAHWAGYELLQRRTPDSGESNRTSKIKYQTSLSWWFTFYLSLALGFLAKGPIAWIPLFTLGAATIRTRDWQFGP